MYKRTLAIVLAVLMVAAALLIGWTGRPPARPNGFVLDRAGLFDAAEMSALAARSTQFCADTGSRFYVAAVRSTGRQSTEKYYTELWENWTLGSCDLLLLLVEKGSGDYYFAYGEDFWDALDPAYDDLMMRWLEPMYAQKTYGASVLGFMEDCIGTVKAAGTPSLGGSYDVYPGSDGYGSYDAGYEPVVSSGSNFITVLIVLLIIFLLLRALSRAGRRGGARRGGNTFIIAPRPRRSIFFTPPPPSRPGDRPASRPSSRPSGFSSRPSGGSSFRGGGRSMGGSSFHGGGRSMGGGSRGGGGFHGGGRH